MIEKYLIDEYKSRAKNCLSKGEFVQMSPTQLLRILAAVEAAQQHGLQADWAKVAVCPSCKADYDVELAMCISCGLPTAKA